MSWGSHFKVFRFINIVLLAFVTSTSQKVNRKRRIPNLSHAPLHPHPPLNSKQAKSLQCLEKSETNLLK